MQTLSTRTARFGFTFQQFSLGLLACVSLALAAPCCLAEEAPAEKTTREKLIKTMQEGNYNDAYQGFRKLALDPEVDPASVGQDLTFGLSCLQQLGRVNEMDEFREAVIKLHEKNWRLLQTAAQTYLQYEHYGFMVAGQFHRGQHRGGGNVVNGQERDRIRALQLMVQALPLLAAAPAGQKDSQFYLNLAEMLLNQRGYHEAWRLQYLSDLTQLPDYEEGWGYYGGETSGAPVDAEGNPVFHVPSKTWEAAETDGQRWRWALEQAVETSPARMNEVRFQFASFLQAQFGVQTMAQYGYFFGRGPALEEEGQKNESGTYALHTLKETETIARLASGIKRFPLPDEFNYIKIFQQIADDDKTGYGDQALTQLAQIFENRRQYPRAADVWRQNIARFGGAGWKPERLTQIIGNWGRFELSLAQPAGQGATIDFRFRNGKAVSFEAHEIKHEKLLADVKAYLKSKPKQLDWQKMDISNYGWRLVQENQQQYIGEQVAKWEMKLEPAETHFDRRITVATPLQKAGAYMLTATMADGNVSKVIIWISDTAIVKKPMQGKALYYVCDAVTGKPISKANVEFFGYSQAHVQGNEWKIDVKQFAEFSDAEGLTFLGADEANTNHTWLVTATTKAGRFAYLGFSGVWNGTYYDSEYNETKVFSITDRPVYRPEQNVQFKFWIGQAQYDQEGKSPYAGQSLTMEITNPLSESVFRQQLTADGFGGVAGEFKLPADAKLGVYQLLLNGNFGGNFRVEEYKKPEFEVTVDAPTEPVMLGEKITATIKAKYYFGSPVTQAKVKYKVLRTTYSNQWYPFAPWDWLYGRGYWWFAYDYDWYPGWARWGCEAPFPWWFWRSPTPPEVVAERETEIGPDGTLAVEIDTMLAKEIHPDHDHSYQIVAEVVDESRRTIVGNGTVLAARQPFKVFAWVNRGYFRVGQVISANFSARTLDDKPVQGQGLVTLYQLSYSPEGKLKETVARTWPLDTDEQGLAKLQVKASVKGQYRLSYEVTDAKEHKIEGGYVFTIIGDGFDGAEFRFNDLELVTDKREYKPGEKIKLQVNTNRLNGTVLLFTRPANGVYLAPQVLQLSGKSQVVEIDVVKKDMPNFFIEALTVAGAKVFTETREIHVPPEKRIMNVEVVASEPAYKPGEKAKVTVKMTDLEGRAFIGSTVLAIYDKSVEYISGGSNVPEIKEFFWKWRRSHSINTESSLTVAFGNMTLPGQPGMGDLGVFGASVADEVGEKYKAGAPDERLQGKLEAMPSSAPAAAMEGAALGDFAAAGKPGDARADADLAGGGGFGRGGQSGAEAPPAQLVQPTVRSNFADTALWRAALTTNSDGLAEVELDMPENLTTWKIKVWGMGDGTRVGQGETEVVTRKDLIIRLQAPRFFVQKDEVVLSANVHNYLAEKKEVSVALELEGPVLEAMDNPLRTAMIDSQGEQRIDWRVRVLTEGQAVIRMKALTDQESDAMEMKFPAYIHGMLKMDSYSGAIRPDKESGSFTYRVPEERRPEQSQLEVRYSPTLAGAMVDALPYLIDYPYGCTEQTLNRFLPAVITQKVLLDMGLDLAEIQKKRSNLNAQEIGDDQERAKRWQRYDRNPVFDQAELTKIVKAGVQRLTEMQLSDGGWGWFSGWGEHSSPHTTAVVVHGLQVAQQNDVALVPGILDRGVGWLTGYQEEQVRWLQNVDKDGKVIDKDKPAKHQADNQDALVFMVLADAEVKNDAMRDFLYRDRTHLSVYALGMYGLALHKQEQKEKLAMILENISQFVVQDAENQTAYLNLPEGFWWYWYGSEYEAHAYYLKLLAATDPKSETASRMVKYLLNNRKHATYWNSTRDTALVVEGMADYIRASGEDKPDLTVEVWLDGEKQKEVKVNGENLFSFDNKFVLDGEAVKTGEHKLELRKQGAGPLYWNGYLTTFTLEDHIPKVGLEIKVQRKIYKLNPVDKKIKVAGSHGQAVDQKVEKYEREELAELALLKSGDLVEVELEIDSKNDYEYILFEDMKAAGFEAVEVRSGYNGNDLHAYVEFRDNRVAFFVRQLARGKHSVSYRLRAEIPGRFSALPARASAMYAPELQGNSDEIKLQIAD